MQERQTVRRFELLWLCVTVHLVTVRGRKAPAGGQSLARALCVWNCGATGSVPLTLAFRLDIQNASTVDHRMYHSLVKGTMVYLVLISIYWAFLQQENLASS